LQGFFSGTEHAKPAGESSSPRGLDKTTQFQGLARGLEDRKTQMSVSVFERLRASLEQQGAAFTVLRHEPVFTSEQAAAVRGTSLASGAKALVLKAGDTFQMVVLPADRKLDSKKARETFGVKSVRFASKEEVEQLTGLQPGSIPPFGSLFGLKTYCDPALALNTSINFNAGDHAISVQMPYSEYERVETPVVATIT
jgi:Ala-tRNA(Pro) deacylase